ncbi:DUF732 domain-containing protein [Mycobacterium sherrisii]|uniref:DUF732 domain-containing protein n=1 Tax=Mycobacterium sherrisii TaxID=243061 RepID=UPI003974B56A
MRDRETIESELRRLAQRGGQLSPREADALLDELLAHNAGASRIEAVTPEELVFVPDAWLREPLKARKPRAIRARGARRRRRGTLRRFGMRAALPLSLLALVAAVILTFVMHRHYSAAQPAEAQPAQRPPSSAAPQPAAPPAPGPRSSITDKAFVAALTQEGVPVPSQEYVVSQGRAVCDYLAQHRNYADAVAFVQRSSIWDADQSAEVTAGAIISYCPQSQPSMADELQPAYQNTLSDLQAIEGKLQGIQDDLHGIQGGLDNLPGHP